MPTTIKLPTPLRRHAQQARSVDVQGNNVGDALAALVEQYPDIRPSLYDEAGRLKSFVRVFVGGDDIDSLDGLDTAVTEGNTISIIPPVAGA